MRRSTKSVLLSALVFPGAGHIFLKQYLRGAALMIVAAVGLTVVVVNTIQQALAIVETLQEGGEVPLDTQLLAGLLSKSASGSEGTVLDIATYAIILCWIIGVFDSYRVGKSQDASDDINRT